MVTPNEQAGLLKGELVRITADSPALAGQDARVIEATAFELPISVRFARNGYRIGKPPFVVCVGGVRDHETDFTAAVAGEFVERP